MRAALLSRSGIGLVEVEPAPPPPGWVRMRVAACGICGSDLHAFTHRAGEVGRVPGHEIAARPLEPTEDLPDGLYAIDPRVSCGGCELCRRGARQLCPDGRLIGIHLPGALADWVDCPRESLHLAAGGLDAATVALAEPLAVAIRALGRARLEREHRVLILGAGSVGLLVGLLARERAEEVAIVGRHAHQRAAAERLGLLALHEAEGGAPVHAPDVVIETVGGRADTLGRAISICRPGGVVVALGLFDGPTAIDARRLVLQEIDLRGSNTYGEAPGDPDGRTSELAQAVAALPRYRAELAALRTHALPLEEAARAFECAADKASGAIKVTVLPE